MDAIYLLRKSKTGEEIRFSLRSLDAHVKGIDRVFIFGYLPPFLDPAKVHHHNWNGPVGVDGQELLSVKMFDAMRHDELSEDVLYLCDDFVVTQPVDVGDFKPWALENLACHSRAGEISAWQKMLWKTYDYCRAFGFAGFNWETHTPKVLNRARFTAMMEKFRPAWENAASVCDAITYETAYFNMFPPEKIEYAHAHRACFMSPANESAIYEASMKPFKMFFYSDAVASDPAFQATMQKMFPAPSRWELNQPKG